MGIKGLHKWMARQFASAFSDSCLCSTQALSSDQAVSTEIDRLTTIRHAAIDLMSWLHIIVRRSAHEMFVYQKLFERIDSLLSAIPYATSLILAVDGPGKIIIVTFK